MIDIIYIIIGIAVGLAVGILLMRSRRQQLLTELQVARTQLDNARTQASTTAEDMQHRIDEEKREARELAEALKAETQRLVDSEKAEAQQQLRAAKEEWAEQLRYAVDAKDKACSAMMAAQEQRHREATAAQQARFEEMMKTLSAHVKGVTDDMLRERQREFAEQSNANLGQIVTPLRETIDRMKQAMADNTLRQTAMSSEMGMAILNANSDT